MSSAPLKRSPHRGEFRDVTSTSNRLPWLSLRLGIRVTGLLPVAILLICAFAHADRSPYEWALVRLDFARGEKAASLRRFCERIHELARQAGEDQSIVGFFNVNLEYARAVAQGPVPETLTASVSEVRKGFNQYYIEHYLSFYDFLFVDRQGQVFYTLRKESDFDANLLQEADAENPLTQCLRAGPDSEEFVDFHEYGPSGEPAAFFIEPIQKEGKHLGWVVLQCSINKVNTLFAWNEDLGRTGETFLVNQAGYMLTESNFEGASTILTMRLDDRNIQAKFAEGQGHRTVTDYRGFKALSSFEVMPFLGARWLVVAKIDKDEVTTGHYVQHRRYYAQRLTTFLEQTPPPAPRDVGPTTGRASLRVDMDEFLKAGPHERIETWGVSTCTGLVATRPGRFAYLAHVSPRDRAYGSDGTNLLGQMVKQIRTFDVYPSESRDLTFIVVATHLDSLFRITDKLIEEGFLLSQIRLLYNKDAAAAAIRYDHQHDDLAVAWDMKDSTLPTQAHSIEDVLNVGRLMEELMAAEETNGSAAGHPAAGRIHRELP